MRYNPNTQLQFPKAADGRKGVYVYQSRKPANAQRGRSSKKRKVVQSQNDASLLFVPLLDGKEDAGLVKLRYATFQKLWLKHEERIRVCVNASRN